MIAYLSDAVVRADELDCTIDAIVAVAKRENKSRDITGVLFHVHDRFLQIIEGQEPHLRQLMRNIEADKRHGNIVYLIDTPVPLRGFKKWNMDVFKLGRGQVFDAKTLQDLTVSFQQALLPRSNILARYYEVLKKEKTRVAS